jgi:PAS domain-containing protein
MKPTNSVLVAYSHDGFRSALKVLEALKPIADVQLRAYDSEEALASEPDVALCIVTDEESIDQAHHFQVQLDDVPTVVVDGSGALKIEVNGYAGRISSSPDQVVRTVQHLLSTQKRSEAIAVPKSARKSSPRRISSPFDHALARASGGAQSPQAVLMAAARQLFWDLRADRGEVFLRMLERNGFYKIYSEPEARSGTRSSVSPEVIRLIKRRCFPVVLHELETRAVRPLRDYLASRHLNLLIPLVREARLLGWMAFAVEDSRCTDEVLDDLQIVGHLLTTSVAEAFDRELSLIQADGLSEAFASLQIGVLTIDRDGHIVSLAGTTVPLGSGVRQGDHYRAIHNSWVREIAAEALAGRFLSKTWQDFALKMTMTCTAASLAGEKVVLFWQPRQSPSQAAAQDHLDLREVLESLPVPVLVEDEGYGTCPSGRVSEADVQAIKDCALQAQAKNVKALRLRWGQTQSPKNAVLFYESDIGQGIAEFIDDVNHAVRFSLEAA